VIDCKTYSARWLFPVDAAPLERGTLTIADGKIVAVKPHGARTADVDLGNVAILPGFVNAHTHLDLSGARGQCPPTPNFTQWLRGVIAFRQARTPEQVQTDITSGIAECLRYGTTTIGDIASGGASWDLLSRSKCRSVVFYELLGLSEERSLKSWDGAVTWLFDKKPTENCTHGLSPHAPYTAESRDELELLRDRTGPLVELFKQMGVWDDSGLVHDPLEVLRMLPFASFVHGNYLDPATEFELPQRLVICPRTHAAFGHPRHPFPAFLQRGVRVALGTDSLASNPDLDILAEARYLRQYYLEVEPATLLRMLTLNGAETLRFDPVTGSLTVGKSADFVVLPLPNTDARDPHELLFNSALPIQSGYFQGERTFAESIP
jgi:cytosine/adenosine deaminase-related metal-dependent hydrolase